MLFPLSSPMIDKAAMLDSVAVRTNESNVCKRVVLPIAIFVVESKNLGVLVVSAPFAAIINILTKVNRGNSYA